ncbi:MAG: hypothetical protein ACFFB3_23340 [Candidatus Hodarchaeota archaeon]
MEIPESLKLGTTVLSVSVTEPIEFYNREDYLLVELNPQGNVPIYRTRKTITRFLDKGKKPVALRGYGPRGISTTAVIAHLIKVEEEGNWEFYFETFSARNPKGEKQMTGLQVVLLPITESK